MRNGRVLQIFYGNVPSLFSFSYNSFRPSSEGRRKGESFHYTALISAFISSILMRFFFLFARERRGKTTQKEKKRWKKAESEEGTK